MLDNLHKMALNQNSYWFGPGRSMKSGRNNPGKIKKEHFIVKRPTKVSF